MIRVLIIEDDPMVAKFNAIFVERIPEFKLVGVARGIEEGWTYLNEEAVDLILLDVYMTNENGLDLLMELRRENHPVDVIVVSSANDRGSIQTALRFGAVDYLIKPFEFDRFQDALLRYKQTFQDMKKEAIQQEEVDRLFLTKGNSNKNVPKADLPLPKGITKETYIRVLREINKHSDWFSTNDLVDATGISRVSLRKYLQYLTNSDILLFDVDYQRTGRPLHQYKLTNQGYDYIVSVLKEEK
ncbi:response regulator [Alkalihalophilus pseudofirmus]|jgi:CitB family two-component system response regulator MalR|nr:response regulator [Alkalihalophilus pseudofirmus]